MRDAAAAVLDVGCAGLRAQKSDVTSQLCQGPLRDFFPWCAAEDYRCEPPRHDLDPTICNGSELLGERPYDQATYATSHNAFSAASMGFLRPNQSKRMYAPLRDGMRALMIDSDHDEGGVLSLCHVDCAPGSDL